VLKKLFIVAALAVTGLLMTPSESWAQRGGRGGGWGGGRGGGWGGGRGGWGGWGPGVSIGLGYGGWGYGNRGWYGGYGGYGYDSWPTYGYDTYAYDTPSYYYSPSYTTPSYATPAAYSGEEQESANDAQNRAFIQVRVPNNAEVLFEGERTSQTGAERRFISPPLQPGKTFTYDIRARWTGPDGKPMEQTRQVKVQAGRRSMVDFMASATTNDRDRADTDLNRNRLPDNKVEPNKTRVPEPKPEPNKNELPLPKQP